MSASCIGTCPTCGEERFWLSDTASLQLDDGRLKCLPHPGERSACENEGLTLAQASERGRLYRETFYVCRNCGRDGETIEKQTVKPWADETTFTVRGAMNWGWGSAAFVIPFLLWMRWWQGKIAKALAARGLPRADAPGRFPVAAPAAGRRPGTVIGRPLPAEAGARRATGPCCDRPDWVEAFAVRNEDRVPCPACGNKGMVVSAQAIH
jgi:DNA-directed RNA polymerase subunit RPC12/RpoP